ncbi:HAD family hydrolase [Streptomyces sp. cmx-18-6]|uniref:HAD family hydrolase n=1 Tax=Streptomyces sp. cmx-18-6 TaxID=2790930 RepID=UPI0039815F15
MLLDLNPTEGGPALPPGHLVFDFNGTLLDDNAARLRALNDSLAALGVAPIGMPQYRQTFCVPVPRFYARLLGRALTAQEWELADGIFQRRYPAYARTDSVLMNGAAEVLAAWADAGHSQSVLSLHTHAELLQEVERLAISPYFTLVDGRRGPTGGTKADAMRRHLELLPVDVTRVVAIGDTLDDALAARNAGIPAVLYSGGAQLGQDLASAGVPVAGSLREAVDLARVRLGMLPGTASTLVH